MANYHNVQSFWGSWVQTQAWPSQEQLHLTWHVEPTLGLTHKPILTFPMGSWWHSSEQMAERDTREKPSWPTAASLFQPPSRTAQSWHEAHYSHCVFLSWCLFSGQATNPEGSILSSANNYCGIWFLIWMMLAEFWICWTDPACSLPLPSIPQVNIRTPH